MSIFEKFDKLIILSEGEIVYFGTREECKSKFAEFGFNFEDGNFSDSLLEIFYKKSGYQEHNQHENKIREMINFYAEKAEYDEKIEKTKNCGYIDKSYNHEHVTFLMMRRFSSHYHTKMKFLKMFYFKFIALGLLTILAFKVINETCKDVVKQLPNYEAISATLKNDQTLSKAANYHQISNIVFVIPSLIALFSLYSFFGAFYHERENVLKEISSNSYSITSYYFSVLFYELILQMLPPFLIFTLVFIAFSDLCTSSVILAFTMTIFALVPYALLLGSITYNKRRILFVAIFFGLLIIIPPILIQEQMTTIDPNDVSGASYFRFIYLLVPFHFFTSAIGYLIITKTQTILGTKIDDDSLKSFKEILDYRREAFLTFCCGYKLNIYVIVALAIFLPLFCILLNIIVIAYQYCPEMRSEFSKTAKKNIKDIEIKAESLENRAESAENKTESTENKESTKKEVETADGKEGETSEVIFKSE